jgi:hypothetical protein
LDDAFHGFADPVDAALQVIDVVGKRLGGLAREQGLVDLDPAAAGRGQGADLGVEPFG